LKTIHTVVAVIGVALIGGGAWWWQNKAPQTTVAAAGAPGASTGAAGGGVAGRPAGAPAGGPRGPGGPTAVEVATAQAVKVTDDVQAVGSLRSRQGVTLRPEVSGRVSQLGFRDGQPVRRGQLMLQLYDTLQRAQLQQAQAQAHIARTNLQRSRELLAQNFVSQSAVDTNDAALQVAEAQVALAQAQLARMRVLAPFDGVAGIRSVDVGEYIKDGADVVSLEDLSALTVDFRLPERYVTRVRTGQNVEVTLDAVPGREFTARVEALDSQVDTNGRALLVRARVDDRSGTLRPGMFARGRVVFEVRDNAVMVPEEALVPLGSRQYLFKVVDGAEGQKRAERIEARIGVRQPGRVEILQGLTAGDVVVTAGHARLRGENPAVRVVNLNAAGGGGSAAPGGPGAAGAPQGPQSQQGPQGPAAAQAGAAPART
jgi:membrane fusion protein (multidrug efflux system)